MSTRSRTPKDRLSRSKKSLPTGRSQGKLPFTIGVDIGATATKFGVVQGARIVHGPEVVQTASFARPTSMLNLLATQIAKLQRKYPVSSVGIGFPGFVDAETGTVLDLTNVKGWRNVRFATRLTRKTKLPCYCENDAKSMCYAEFLYGAGRGARNMLAITLGTGVGGAMVLDSKLYRGSANLAGEIGQISIDINGVAGEYGNPGALEKYVGHREISALAQSLYSAAGSNSNSQIINIATLIDAASKKDLVARKVWNVVAAKLAYALANCVWLIDPERIVVGGGVASAGRILFGPLQEELRKLIPRSRLIKIQLLPAELGNDAGLIGAAALANSKTFAK